MTEFAEMLGRCKQSRLSQFETRPEGPPLDIVEQYADFFKLKGRDRVDFFFNALESSGQIVLDTEKLSPVVRESIFKLLAIFLANNTIGDTIDKWHVANNTPPDYGRIFEIHNGRYGNLFEKWKNIDKAINDFLEEELKL